MPSEQAAHSQGPHHTSRNSTLAPVSPGGSVLRNINQSQDVMHNISIAESIELQGEQDVMDDYGASQHHSKRESTSNATKTPKLLVHD